jgi:hypothetical protein
MKYTLSSSRFVVGSLVVAAAFTLGARPAPSFEEREVARIRAHFDSVFIELESRDLSRLTAAQRSARATHIARLKDYRDAGVFPKNLVSSEPTPVFVDPTGVQCAMGYLIAQSGRTDLVDRIATTRNLARIPELADDPALVAWLDSAGLTVAEAARIQPQYEGGGCLCPGGNIETVRAPATRRGYQVSSGVYAGLSTTLIAANLMRPGRMGFSLAGATVGAAGIALAASHMSNTNAPSSFAAMNGVFAAATIASAWRSARIAKSAAYGESTRPASAQTTVTPIVGPSAVGISIRLRM